MRVTGDKSMHNLEGYAGETARGEQSQKIQKKKSAFLSGTFLNFYKAQYPPYLGDNMLFTG
jgi:hypothetical protein